MFALALAVRAGRPPQRAAHQAELTLAFVAAHGIHYATVVARAAIEPENRLRELSIEPLAVVAAGFGLLALLEVPIQVVRGLFTPRGTNGIDRER